ncbi:hypothetical protein WME76_36350 [Sorangium sp. So ce119]|uniref:hypothetical protein n=1 Tax=Sorangium sp. So ce119 TaxID=3133279 RepID=UPI003F643807
MTDMLREVVGTCCAAAVAFTAGQASAMQPPPAPAPQVSPASPAPTGGPAAAPPAPPPGDGARPPPSPAPPPGDAASPPPGPAPSAGAWGAPPGYPPPPPGWTWSPIPGPPGSGAGGELPPPKTVWYGWQHLVVLLGSLAVVPIAVATESEGLAWVSFSGAAIGGPVTHWANGNLGKGFISLGLNAGCTFGGGMIGMLLGSMADDRFAALGGLVLGGGVGLVTANIIDIAVLEVEERGTVESYDYLRVRSPRLRLAPQVGLAPGGATFGLVGSF